MMMLDNLTNIPMRPIYHFYEMLMNTYGYKLYIKRITKT